MNSGNEHQCDILNEAIYPKYVCKFQKNHSQKYDRRGQYHAITHNPKLDHKLPMVVKFPMISPFFEQITNLPYANQGLGVFNGLYIIPDDTNLKFQLPEVKIGTYEPLLEFFQSPRFKLLDTAFNLIYDKLDLLPQLRFNNGRRKIDFTKNQQLIVITVSVPNKV